MIASARRIALALLLLPALAPRLAALGAEGVPVSGRVLDGEGRPVAGATVSLVELKRGATTDGDGRFQLVDVPPGLYTLSARRLGYAAGAQRVTVATTALEVNFTLDRSPVRVEPVNVTAVRSPIADAASPLPMSVLSGDEVHAEGGVSLAHSVARLPGVRNVSTGQQVGKPMIRGLFGPRVLVLTDGSRLEDYSWSDEDGPSLDARIADRIEVIRGPASVLYGSEALSGVVNVIPSELTYSSDGSRQLRPALQVYGGSNNIEMGGVAMAEGAYGNRAWRLMATGRFGLYYQTPDGEMPNSSFFAFNGEGAYGIRGAHGSTTLRAAHYGGEFGLLEVTGPEPGDPDGGPIRQVLDDRLQVTNDRVMSNGLRLETKAQFQRHFLAEVSDDCMPVPPATTCTKVKDQQAFGLTLNTITADVLAHHGSPDRLSGTVGVSGMLQLSGSSGPIFLVPGATINSGAVFALEQLTLGRLSLMAGGRVDHRGLSSDDQPEISHTADDRTWSAVSGDVGAMVRLTSALSLNANFGTGWRAPTLFDLYANGPNNAEARYEQGDATLKAERAATVDAGVRWTGSRLRASVTAYNNAVSDFIFTTPTAATIGGLQVFQHTQADASLWGGEASIEARVTSALTLRASHDRTLGEDQSAGVPLPLMPPARSVVGAQLFAGDMGSFRRVKLGGEVEMNAKQDRLNPMDYATDGYTLVNLNLSFEHAVPRGPGRFDVIVRNALNTSYKDFLSRFKTFSSAPGINVIVKASAGAW